MLNERIEEVKRYFLKRTEKVYIENGGKIESFGEYLYHRYCDNCYYYSAYALMGLKPDDYLVRGYIALSGIGDPNYHHGWVEFMFEENEYVFDFRCEELVLKQKWYDTFKPQVEYQKTQKEILEEYLNERCAFKIQETFWQFKYFVTNDANQHNMTCDEMFDYDRKNGHVPSALKLARVEINEYKSEIGRFIAYSECSG